METLFSGIERLNNQLFKKRCMDHKKKCTFCGANKRFPNALFRHMNMCKVAKKKQPVSSNLHQPSKRLKCKHCGMQCKRLASHLARRKDCKDTYDEKELEEISKVSPKIFCSFKNLSTE